MNSNVGICLEAKTDMESLGLDRARCLFEENCTLYGCGLINASYVDGVVELMPLPDCIITKIYIHPTINPSTVKWESPLFGKITLGEQTFILYYQPRIRNGSSIPS